MFCARSSVAAWRGVTSSVTDRAPLGSALAATSASTVVCTASSSRFWSRVEVVTASPPGPVGVMVSSTSTRSPGWIRPARLDEKLGVWMVKARIPGGIIEAIPGLAPFGSSLGSMTNSPSSIGIVGVREVASSTEASRPAGACDFGTARTSTWSTSIAWPRGRGAFATTAGTVSSTTGAGLFSDDRTPQTAARPLARASSTTPSVWGLMA